MDCSSFSSSSVNVRLRGAIVLRRSIVTTKLLRRDLNVVRTYCFRYYRIKSNLSMHSTRLVYLGTLNQLNST
jgi:hypothetical protein